MEEKKRNRLRFSIRTLMAIVTLTAVGLGLWIAYTNYKIHKLEELRQVGAIVVIRDETPQWMKSIGIERLGPFCSVPTVELYVTPMGTDALIGDSDTVTSNVVAQTIILEQASAARANGAENIQLILIDRFDPEWMTFANDNSLSPIGDSKQRYIARLKANLESGANINP